MASTSAIGCYAGHTDVKKSAEASNETDRDHSNYAEKEIARFHQLTHVNETSTTRPVVGGKRKTARRHPRKTPNLSARKKQIAGLIKK